MEEEKIEENEKWARNIERTIYVEILREMGKKIEDYICTRAFTGYMKYKLHIEECGRREEKTRQDKTICLAR